jgi:16S rRNA (uracil1498-N3)-methyltransferase
MNPALRRAAAHVFVQSLEDPYLEPDDQHHLVRVLRLREQQIVSVTDGAGQWRLCRLAIGGELIIDSEIVREPTPSRLLTVGFAIPKADRPEWIVQKLTEIGVDRIVMLYAGHSIVRWDESKVDRQLERLTKVAREAAMQSRRTRHVELVGPLDVSTFIECEGGCGVALAEPGGQELAFPVSCVLIGPEGGWTDTERALSTTMVGLGDTVLRVETAALVAGVRLIDERTHDELGRTAE